MSTQDDEIVYFDTIMRGFQSEIMNRHYWLVARSQRYIIVTF